MTQITLYSSVVRNMFNIFIDIWYYKINLTGQKLLKCKNRHDERVIMYLNNLKDIIIDMEM